MNLAQMLYSTVTPLSARKPIGKVKLGNLKVPVIPKGPRLRRCEAANIAVQERAIKRYKDVMPTGEWVSTTRIEARLGNTRCVAYKTLTKWLRLDLVERRPFGGKPYSRRDGYEWRFKE